MTMTSTMMQHQAMPPAAALVGQHGLVPMAGGWHGGIANPWECGTNGTLGFTAKRSTRRLGRSST